MNRAASILVLLMIALSSQWAVAQDVGETVIALRATAVKRGKDVLEMLPPGTILKVQDVQGDWVWVSVEKTGWAARKNVADPKQAVAFFSERIQESPKEAPLYVARGNAKLADRQFDEAIADFTEALRHEPNAIAAFTGRALALADKSQVEPALADADRALRIDPQSASALFLRGSILAEAGQFEKAIADLSECLRLSPEHASAFRNRSGVWLETRDYERALADATRATEINPKSAIAYANRGAALLAVGKIEEAFADLDEAVTLDPQDPHLLVKRGMAYNEKREFKKAIADFSAAMRLNLDGPTYLLRAHAHAESGNIDEAVADYTGALKLDSTNLEALTQRSTAWMYKHRYGLALKDVSAILNQTPDDAAARRRRALLLAAAPDAPARAGRPSPDAVIRRGRQAVADAVRACELTRWQHPESLSVLAAAYAELGDFARAVEWETKALRMTSDKETQTEFTATLKLYRLHKPYRLPRDAETVVPASAQRPAGGSAKPVR